jgi:hypothetical protein
MTKNVWDPVSTWAQDYWLWSVGIRRDMMQHWLFRRYDGRVLITCWMPKETTG